MPEDTTSHPGSWLGDLTNEWKKAKTPEKVLIVGAVAATVGIALYLHSKSSAPNQPGASGLAGIPTNFQQGGGGGGGGTTSGGGTTAQPPTQNPPTPTPTPTPTPKTPPINQPTTTTKTYAATNHAGSSPSVESYKVQGVSPTVARVSAQRIGILQLRQQQTPPPLPKPILRVTPVQTYLQVGNKKYY